MRNILSLCLLLFLSFGCEDPEPMNNPGGGGSALPSLSIDNVTAFEGDSQTTFDFRVRLSEASSDIVTVEYRTDGNTAAANDDFVPSLGTLEFEPNTTTKDIQIELVTDTIKEQDEEFRVILSNAVNATISSSTAIGTIRNDDEFVFVPEDGYTTPENYAGYNKIFADEFDGNNIDLGFWTHEQGDHGWGNNEWQNYTNLPQNSYISDGKLIIEAIDEGNGAYSSARMITRDKFEFTFGRVDIRAKLPFGQGIWPALWMLGENITDIGWPACGEIDIMELLGHESHVIHGTAHWGNQGDGFSQFTGNAYGLPGGARFEDEFHVFSIVWENNSIEWYLDDQLYHSINASTVGNFDYPFNRPFFFIFNIAVGGNWPGYPDASTQFPQRMFVDYIRVFQKQ